MSAHLSAAAMKKLSSCRTSKAAAAEEQEVHTAGDAFCAGQHSDSRNAECPALGKQDFELPLSEEMAELLIELGGSLKM